jgi:protoporphyrinogen oxidase
LKGIEQNLMGILCTGASYYGISVNDCIQHARLMAEQFAD